jgi:hypothetical protein
VNELIDFVARRAGLERIQAEAAVGAAIEYLTARLPSPVVGHIHQLLRGADSAGPGAPTVAAP